MATWAVPVVGAVLLVLLGVMLPFVIPAAPTLPVPSAVLEAEAGRTTGASESVRRSLNEAVDDLVVASRTAVDGGSVQPVIEALTAQRGRYHGVAWVDGTDVAARAGADFPVPADLAAEQAIILQGDRDGEPFVILSSPVP